MIPIEVLIDKSNIIFKFENGHEYDPDLSLTKNPNWIYHMREKVWFTKEVEEKTIKALRLIVK